MKFDNKTLHGIKEETERYILLSWSMIVLLASLIGDSIILIGTIKYKAIRQHKLIIAVIQNMAVCDLLQTVLRVFPVTPAFITDRWMLGELFCHVDANIGWLCGGVTMFLTCCMTTLKLMIVKRPLRAGTWTAKLGHIISTAMWSLALFIYTPILVVNMTFLRRTLHFSYREYDCNYDYYSSNVPVWYTKYFGITLSTFSVLCYITLTVTSTLLLNVARRIALRQRRSLRWEGITTVLLTVLVLLVSYLPHGVVTVTSFIGLQHSSTLRRAMKNFTFLNITANFFIYCLTIRSFRLFLKLKISELINLWERWTQQREPTQEISCPTQGTGSTQINTNIQDASL
jgi:hypothetical protein